MTYLAPADADATAAKIKGAGGQLVMEPMDVMNAGKMAVAVDPASTISSVWQARAFAGANKSATKRPDQLGNVGSGRTSRPALTAGDVHTGPRHGGEKMTERTSERPPDEAPEGFREQPRYPPTADRAYPNDRIEVTWDPA
jgi:hypothetical protein